jgi:hypothetical protein
MSRKWNDQLIPPRGPEFLCKLERAENLEAELPAAVGLAREPRFARAKRWTGFAA